MTHIFWGATMCEIVRIFKRYHKTIFISLTLIAISCTSPIVTMNTENTKWALFVSTDFKPVFVLDNLSSPVKQQLVKNYGINNSISNPDGHFAPTCTDPGPGNRLIIAGRAVGMCFTFIETGGIVYHRTLTLYYFSTNGDIISSISWIISSDVPIEVRPKAGSAWDWSKPGSAEQTIQKIKSINPKQRKFIPEMIVD